MLKFVRKIITYYKMRREAREVAYGILCEEQKDKMFSWDRDLLRDRSRQTRQGWIMAALDGDAKKQTWLASCIESGMISVKK